MDEVAVTVRGDIELAELGAVLMHEHLFIDLTPNAVTAADPELVRTAPVTVDLLPLLRRNPIGNLDNCVLDDLDMQTEEAARFADAGGGTIVDVTPPGLGRDPARLAALSERTGLHVVAGCGHYTHPNHEPEVAGAGADELAAALVRELTVGIGDSGIRAGIIGEIGTSDPLDPAEAKVLRAAALAQTETAATVTLHVVTATAHDVLDVLEAEGADLARVVVGHQDLVLGTPAMSVEDCHAYYLSLLERGAVLGFDTCGKDFSLPQMPGMAGAAIWTPSDIERARALGRLIESGWGGALVISQDVCHKADLRRFGGNGYGHILRTFVDALHDVGVDDDAVTAMMTSTPQRLLGRPRTTNEGAADAVSR